MGMVHWVYIGSGIAIAIAGFVGVVKGESDLVKISCIVLMAGGFISILWGIYSNGSS
jgi:energy-converting hydrogenase Eha subunit C